jgi:hypothetical protein
MMSRFTKLVTKLVKKKGVDLPRTLSPGSDDSGRESGGRVLRTAAWIRCSSDSRGDRGSVLLLVVVLSAFLAGLLLLALGALLLDKKAGEFAKGSIRLLYLADSGLAHGRAYCRALGETPLGGSEVEGGEEIPEEPVAEEDPFDRWIPFGEGGYRIEVVDLSRDESPYLDRDSGFLLASTASLTANPAKKICLLLDGPPEWKPLARWEPE